MVFRNRIIICFGTLIVFSLILLCTGQNFYKIHQHAEVSPEDRRDRIVWCTVSPFEQKKCRNFVMAIERDKVKVYRSDYFKLECKQAFNKDECMTLLDEEKVTMTTLDSGQVFMGGRYHSLIPIAQEVLEGGFKYYYSVAVIKKGQLPDVTSLRDLRRKRACFPGVGNMAGWVVPIYTLMREAGMKIIDCNNHVKSATQFFGPSCAVNCLSKAYNPIGDNSDKLCQLCIGKIPGGRCTNADPYSGYEGAFRCLLEAGDVAFLKHTTVLELATGTDYVSVTKDRFELLCKDGTRRPVDDYRSCNWGIVPSDAVVTSSASTFEDRQKYQKFLERVVELYGPKDFNNTTADRNRNTFGNQQYDQYDQFGNKINSRFRRQNFNQYNQYNQNDPYRDPNNQSDRYRNPNDQNNPYRNPNDQNDPFRNSGNRDPFNQDERNRYQDPYNQDRNRYPTNQNDRDRFSNNQNNQNRYQENNQKRYEDKNNQDFYNRSREGSRDPYANDPFKQDPYKLNKDQFGINIDPYGTKQPPLSPDRNPFYTENTYDNNGTQYGNDSLYEVFNIFESTPKYGIHSNLLFQDSTKRFAALPENQQTFSGFLGPALDIIMGVRDCPVRKMTLCVTSDVEQEKCVKMRTALKAQLLKPEMNCYKGHSQIHCMQAIRAGTADVAVLDASDVYTAGLNFDLVPFVSEVYNLGAPEYYVVAVAKESDPSTELTYLKNKYTCHGGINTAAGWVYPLAFLISNGWIRPYGCNSIRAAAEYFTKSCVPGALSTEYNTGVPYDNMCDLCHGASYRYCRRDASEDYYGHTGAFRCLVEGGGQVAFVKHTTVMENVGGKRKEWWARDNLAEDFELLCPDGTRAEVQDYKRCNLGKVKANAVVTRGGYGYNETQINAYINLLLYSQTFYGRKIPDEFSFGMFYSPPPYTDLIFQDATQQLKVIEPSKRHYSDYLGSDFMRARRIVDCHAGSASLKYSSLIIIASIVATTILKS